jgi:hypothetical protein
VVNVANGQTFEASTNDIGRYVTPQVLKPGQYRVEASKPGFKTAVSEEIVLQIGDVREINLSLQLGANTETVTVSSQARALETETSSRGEVITGRQTVELPLKDRNFTQLATLMPGVHRAYVGTLTDQSAFNQGDPNAGQVPGAGPAQSTNGGPSARFGRSGGASISVNGLRPTNNNFSVDGVDNNEPQYGTIGIFPNPDAIQEFKVETSIPKAEIGRGGANVNTTYQSGSNDLHGSVYYYGQNEALNATPWVINRNRASNPRLRNSVERINEFGFTLGGPIVKNRTFLFGDFLGQRNKFPTPFSTAVPTAKSRAGDFSEFSTPILDPQTCNRRGDISSGGCSAFPGNVIPNLQSRPDFSLPAFKLLNAFPLPTTNVIDPRVSGAPNFFGVRDNQERINNFDIKLDHRLTKNNNLTGRYSFQNTSRVRGNFFPRLPTAGFGAGQGVGNARQVAIGDTHLFRSTILNEARFGWTSVEIGSHNCGVAGACGASPTFCQDIGIPNCNKGTLATTGFLTTGGTGPGEFEFLGDGGLFNAQSDNFYVSDSFTIISGNHTWKTGVEVRPRHLNTICGGCAGSLKGNLQFRVPTGKPSSGKQSTGPQSTGNVQSDYLLGRPATFAGSGSTLGGENPFELRTTEWALFVQEDWKVTKTLILNLGVRWELFPGYSEASGRYAEASIDRQTGTLTLIRARGGEDRIIGSAKRNFGPRVGFAWNFGPQRKFVLRGGYGIFYAKDSENIPPLTRNPPLTSSVSFTDSALPGFNLTTGPPVALIVDPPMLLTSLSYFDQQLHQKAANIQEWNLTVQWEPAHNWLVDVGYVGTRSRNLMATRELGNNGNGLGLAKTPPGPATATNPTPNTAISSVIAYENRASGNYDALQGEIEKRMAYGLQFSAAYTWGHAIDNSTGTFQGIGDSRGSAGGPLNPFDPGGERGSSSFDIRQVFSSSLIWDLPFGHGRYVGSGISGVADKLISGWQANFIWNAQTGQPFSVVADTPCGYSSRADIVGDPFASLPPDRFLNIAAFRPGSQSVTNMAGNRVCFGNLGRNTFTGPRLFRTDFSVFKNTNFAERYRVQFGLEFFNVFNHVDHVLPNLNVSDLAGFGRFDNALPPRQIQYRMKIFF